MEVASLVQEGWPARARLSPWTGRTQTVFVLKIPEEETPQQLKKVCEDRVLIGLQACAALLALLGRVARVSSLVVPALRTEGTQRNREVIADR